MLCNCEQEYCAHGTVGIRCDRRVDTRRLYWRMEFVGPICDGCAKVCVANDGGALVGVVDPEKLLAQRLTGAKRVQIRPEDVGL